MFKQAKIPRQIGQAVKDKRLEMGLTQSQLAELSNTSRSLVYRLEKGVSKDMSLDKLYSILGALELELAVFDEKGQPKDNEAVRASPEADRHTEESADHPVKSTNHRKAAAKDNSSRNSQAEFEKQLKVAQNIKGFNVFRR